MIRYTYFRFFLCEIKDEKSGKHHVLYTPSFRISFSNSIIEKKKKVIMFPFPFS